MISLLIRYKESNANNPSNIPTRISVISFDCNNRTSNVDSPSNTPIGIALI